MIGIQCHFRQLRDWSVGCRGTHDPNAEGGLAVVHTIHIVYFDLDGHVWVLLLKGVQDAHTQGIGATPTASEERLALEDLNDFFLVVDYSLARRYIAALSAFGSSDSWTVADRFFSWT